MLKNIIEQVNLDDFLKGRKKFEWNDDVMFKRMVKVRDSRSPPNFKLLLSFGGWNYCQETGGGCVDAYLVAMMETTCVVEVLDWEYPGKEDKETYTMLMREMADVFHKRNLLVTAAVPLAKSKMEDGFKVKELAEILDLVNVMTYDCHGGSWENRTGLNSPLYTLKTDKDKFSMKMIKSESIISKP
uniref:GH18 domain-containing protein n=1 Tax=Romanomermis culicivorax TaxID=13658 RepID=A0A915LCX7_ROMCU